MAKKQETVDTSIYVKALINTGMPEADAKERIGKLVDKVNTIMAGESNEARNNIIGIKIRELISASRSEKYTMTVVAVGQRKDSNDYKRNQVYKLFDEAPDTALAQGSAKIVKEGTQGAHKTTDGRFIVAIDNKKFWDEAGTKKNFGFGKPIPVRMNREVIGISDGTLVKAYGDVEVIAGHEYEVMGKVNETSGALYINSEIKPKSLRQVTDLYSMLYEAAKKSENAMDVDGALETDVRGTIFVQGYVLQVAPMNNGKHRVVLNSGYGSELSVFPADDNADKIMAAIQVGTDAIAIGSVRDPKNPQFRRSMTASTVIANPKATAASKALDALKDYEF